VLLDEFKNIMPNGPWYQLQVMALPRIADMSSRSEEHLGLFNEAVRSHDWTAFLATRHDPLQLGAGGSGTLELSWREGLVAALVVTFDP
jgi:hypothetical protein